MATDLIKANGVHYTPPELAEFLATAVVEKLSFAGRRVTVLDPACGDGALLQAFIQAVPEKLRPNVELVGYETDPAALERARDALQSTTASSVTLELRDFLATSGPAEGGQLSLLDAKDSSRQFDAIIANPPYVRTQVLGAKRSRALAAQFGLTGRVDLYHAFARAMANVLRSKGVLGLLTSNRFLTVKSGAALRKLLKKEFLVRSVYDLGDTKLFNAAVLPVIVVAEKSKGHTAIPCSFTRIYEHRGDCLVGREARDKRSLLMAIRASEANGFVRGPSCAYRLECGSLLTGGDDEVWSLSTPHYVKWLAAVSRHQCHQFDDVARIRVGIKTTADEVFIRDDWASLPPNDQPEPTVLRPLIRHFDATRWFWSGGHTQAVLYPHVDRDGRRAAVNLDSVPRAKRYLESHFARLNRRRYVVEGGRNWYEIWVPHMPSDWSLPKIVFPDISEEPKFFIDSTGAVVNGDCYWMTLRDGVDPEMLPLMLAVANSTFITRYYDIAFHNKLYAGRRRFMTQYVKKFPLPDPTGPAAQDIIKLVTEILNRREISNEIEARLDCRVWDAFGLVKEVPGQRDL